MSQPDFIKCIRMLRAERGLSFEDAKAAVVKHFTAKGYELPRWLRKDCANE